MSGALGMIVLAGVTPGIDPVAPGKLWMAGVVEFA